MPSNWILKPLGYFLNRVAGGGTPSKKVSSYWEGGIPWASVKDFQEDTHLLYDTAEHISFEGLKKSAANLIPAGVPLICVRMAVGRTALTTQPTAINQDVKALYTNDFLLPEYLLYLLCFHRQQLEAVSIGSTVKGIRLKQLLSLPINVPSPSAQRLIITTLDSLNKQIQHTEQMIAKLKLQREGLLHKLLTCGIDEHGQLRDPVAHPGQFKDSVLGTIPKEWELTHIGRLAETITSGSRGWAEYYSHQGSLFLRISNLTREHVHLRLQDLTYVSPPTNSEGARTAVKSGDILISITADLGIIGVIPSNFDTAYVNQHIALVRFNNGVHPEYIANYLAGEAGQKQFRRLNDSGAKAGLNLVAIANLRFPLPPIQEQRAISHAINSIETTIRVEEEHRIKLKLYKTGLMHDLLTGKVRVGEKQEEGVN